MTPLMLRQLWSIVEATQSNILLNLDDSNLVTWLLRRFGTGRSLNTNEEDALSDYIRSRLPLIRELAQERYS